MNIRVDKTLPDFVLRMLREDYERQEVERGKDLHVSDLLFPRRTWLSARHPKPLTDEDLLYFTAGRAHHEILEKLIARAELREVRVEFDGIVGSVDVLDEGGKMPIEVKTTRVATLYNTATVPSHFVLQLGCYAAMLNPDASVGEGKLLIFYMMGVKDRSKHLWRKLPQLASFDIGEIDLDKVRSMMLRRKMLVAGETIPSTETCGSRLCTFCKWYRDPCDGWGSDLSYRVAISGGTVNGTP
jgi:hypothetical protein